MESSQQKQIQLKIIQESTDPEITKRILDKSNVLWYNFGCIFQTENRIHIRILKDYHKRWLTKKVLTDINNLLVKILKEYRKVLAIFSSNEESIRKLAELFGFSFLNTGEKENKVYKIYELKGINYE